MYPWPLTDRVLLANYEKKEEEEEEMERQRLREERAKKGFCRCPDPAVRTQPVMMLRVPRPKC